MGSQTSISQSMDHCADHSTKAHLPQTHRPAAIYLSMTQWSMKIFDIIAIYTLNSSKEYLKAVGLRKDNTFATEQPGEPTAPAQQL